MITRFLILGLTFLFYQMTAAQDNDFKTEHMKNERVKTAYKEKKGLVDTLFLGQRIKTPYLFIRAFKQEKVLEVWAVEKGSSRCSLVKTYEFCASSGQVGPKRKQGDFQIPEGVYYIDRFNAWSNYYLSLGINYPNKSDKLKSKASNLGGDIFIHGDCVTIGCIPITDDLIKEVYIMAVEAKNNGQEKIPVHIYPARLSMNNYRDLSKEFDYDKDRLDLWKNLKEIYEEFEMKRQMPNIGIADDGRYVIN